MPGSGDQHHHWNHDNRKCTSQLNDLRTEHEPPQSTRHSPQHLPPPTAHLPYCSLVEQRERRRHNIHSPTASDRSVYNARHLLSNRNTRPIRLHALYTLPDTEASSVLLAPPLSLRRCRLPSSSRARRIYTLMSMVDSGVRKGIGALSSWRRGLCTVRSRRGSLVRGAWFATSRRARRWPARRRGRSSRKCCWGVIVEPR